MSDIDPKLIQAVNSIHKTAKKNRWVFELDKNEDSLYYSKPTIPNGAELYQVTDEFAVYLDKEKNIHGIMMEYFQNNFVKHHSEGFKSLVKEIFSKGDIVEIDPNKEKKDNIKIFRNLFETTLMAEAGGADLH